MLLALTALAAVAATPTPDRPSVSRAGYLVAPNTLELEAGLAWSEDARTAPTTLKYAFGEVVEARISANLAGFDRAPGLEAGAKFRLLSSEDVGFAVFLGSAVPTSSIEPWSGTALALVTVPVDAWFIQVNGGLDLVGQPGGVAFGGVPLVGAVGRSLGSSFTVFGEAGATFGGARCGSVCGGVLDAGVGWLLTEILVVDAGLGWDLDNGAPFVQAGLTANFGRFTAF